MSDTDVNDVPSRKELDDNPVMRVELEVPEGVDLMLIINGIQVELD
jgi:hypothetical protein